MELTEATRKKIIVAEEKATFVEMLVCKAEEQVLEVERVFQQAKSHNDAVIKVVTSDKKLKQVSEWLASMHKWMIEARQQEA